MKSINAKLAHVIVVIVMIASFCESLFIQWEYGDIPRPTKKLVPCEIMVDVTNDLAYRTLYYHSIANRNNFAFSPTALASVLIALYEGSNGRSCAQIQNALGLPWSRDIVRIGYRDIHRRLRTYFFEQENPLSGLSLNKENVTISREYEAILKFYGYDLGVDMISANEETAKPETITESSGIETTSPNNNVLTTTSEISESTTEAPKSQSHTEAKEIETTPANEEYMTTSISTNSEKEDQTTDFENEEAMSTTTESSDLITATTEIVSQESTVNTVEESTTFEPPTEATTQLPPTTSYVRTFRPITSVTTSRNIETTTNFPDDITTQQTNQDSSRVSSSQNENLSALFPNRRRPESIKRGRRSYPLSIYNHNIFEVPFAPDTPPYVELEIFNVDPVYFAPRDIGRDHIIDHIFYLNSQETVQTTFKVYNSILNYNYIDTLRSAVLELELDSKDYTLMLFIPDQGFDLDFLLSAIKSAPTLRLVRRSMQQKWVQAIIPDFQLKGRTFLTNDMQYLGISDVFEPLRADLSPMTGEAGIYATHIEQTINVRIRTKPINQIKRDIGPFSKPIEISVNHPFLFFIVDKELDVAIMAGSVLNPLNVRIL